MSKIALHHVNETAVRLVTVARSSPSFRSLMDGTSTLKLYGDWLAQTAHYSAITGEVLGAAARSLLAADGQLRNAASEMTIHGVEEGRENTVIMDDLGTLGIKLSAVVPIPPVETYITMMRTVSRHADWAIGISGVIRTLELLAAECAAIIYQSLSQSSSGQIRGALRFVEAHRDETEHLQRMEGLISIAPPESDFAITWCAEQARLFYQGLLAHLDARVDCLRT